MKILISGGNGGLAQELQKCDTEHNVIALSKQDMDVANPMSVVQSLGINKPDIFIHAAALTRPMKKHDENPRLSVLSNIVGTANVVTCCMDFNEAYDKNIKLIYISTDYVYPGTVGNYIETDHLNPVNSYAWTKLGGECAVKLYTNHLILRSCFTQHPFPHDNAFTDSYKSCIYHHEAAELIFKLIDKDASGTVNLGGKRQSAYEFAIQEREVNPISKNSVDEHVAIDSSMNLLKLNKILKD